MEEGYRQELGGVLTSEGNRGNSSPTECAYFLRLSDEGSDDGEIFSNFG